MKKEIYSISLLKGICAILVVLIHSHLFGKICLVPVYRCAVPIFYMISGYFMMGENGLWKKGKIKGYLRKMVSIWIAVDTIYILSIAIVFNECSPFYEKGINAYSLLQTISLEIFFGGQFCLPLWYITAYVWTLVIIRYLGNRLSISPPLCLTIIVGLLCLNLLLGSYDFLLPFHPWQPFSNINVFTTALPFVMLGGFIKLHFHTLHGIFTKPTARLCLIALSYLEVAALWVVGSKDGDVFIMTPFLSMAILAWFISHPTFGKGSCFTNIGKEYSLNIYLLHFIIIWSVGETCKHYHLNIRNIEFLIVFPLTLFLCYLINLIAPPLKQAYHKLQNKSDLDL